MKLTKALLLTALVAGSFMTANAIVAQDGPKDKPPGDGQGAPGRPGMRGGPNAEQMAKELGLNDEQKAKVKTAVEEMRKKVAAINENTSIAPEDKRAKMREARESFLAEMKKILTPEQFEKFQKMQRNRQGGPGGAPGRGAQPGQDGKPPKSE